MPVIILVFCFAMELVINYVDRCYSIVLVVLRCSVRALTMIVALLIPFLAIIIFSWCADHPNDDNY